ncbi:hypothetical protein PV11_09374 [Exophiala sideris]|uniref:Uncharacterized protein n=1 Tax=Exophiala sideris TaxID=1016849 RepID=A0A0D1VNN3_9EURO|nr:hypothetical protein PV11_09374 [Exophiala sideris]
MASVFEGLIHSRRRPSRSRSESGKQLHARWGDTAISAPHDGTWSQLDPAGHDNLPGQSFGSPDSQKTLVNKSPDLSRESPKFEKISDEEIRQPAQSFIQKERNAITITIPLPWSRKKDHRRSTSVNTDRSQMERVETAPALPELPAPTGFANTIDEVIVAESRPTTEQARADSPIVHTTSPVYNDVSTFFTRAAFPEKGYGAGRLPPIQTSVPPNRSQPALALSILSPVAEKYDGLSESNNVTPQDNTPAAEHIARALATSHRRDTPIDVDGHPRMTPASLTTSRIASPILSSDSDSERIHSWGAVREHSRPSSRGPGLGEVAYMRSESRGPHGQERNGSRGPRERRRSALQGPVGRRAGSVEAIYQTTQSREPSRQRASPSRRRTLSRDPALRRSDSPPPVTRRAESPVPAGRRAVSQDPESRQGQSSADSTRRALSREPASHRADSPAPLGRRTKSREPSRRRGISPRPSARRAISREPFSHRPDSVDLSKRAASVDPTHRRASPREDYGLTCRCKASEVSSAGGNSSNADLSSSTSAEEATDIETETDEIYFESRKGWNGPAVVDGESKGFYAAVIQDYRAIARDVEAEIAMAGEAAGVKEVLVNLVTNKKDKEKEKQTDLRIGMDYVGPALVPSNEELWG